ncbi:hypothetical protein [Herbiconiux sp. YIM B11900]|uniref:hypothetical protein n=1 Tax=Herbiconiux sp. YIM B11900 TaxID=3404131 RepID=UPI003F82E441
MPAAVLCAALSLSTGALAAHATPPPPGSIQLVDVSTTPGVASTKGLEGILGNEAISISGNGRYVAFISSSPDLPEALPGQASLYLRDLVAGWTRLIGDSNWIPVGEPSVSDDGSVVAYSALNTGVSPFGQAVVWTTDTDTTALISDSYEGAGHGVNSEVSWVKVSASGHEFLYMTGASDVVAGDLDLRFAPRAYLRDARGDTVFAAGDPTLMEYQADLSADGRFIVFLSWEDHTALPANRHLQVYVRDRLLATTQLVSRNLGATAGGDGDSLHISMSSDGRYVSFDSNSSDLASIAHRDLGKSYSYLYDRSLDHLTVESLDSAGDPVPGNAPSISDDASKLTYIGEDDQVYLRSRALGSTRLLSLNRLAESGNGDSGLARISADGHFVSLASQATNLTGDTYPAHAIPPSHVLVANIG